MDLRDPAPIPVVFDLTRFLVSSITFMAHLRQVSVYLDGIRLAVLNKDAGLPAEVTMLRGLTPVSPSGYMKITGLKSTRRWFVNGAVCSVLKSLPYIALYITAEVADCVYNAGGGNSGQAPEVAPEAASLPPPESGESAPQRAPSPLSGECPKFAQFSLVLTIFTAEADVSISDKLSEELRRSMRKPPPRTIKYELVYVCDPTGVSDEMLISLSDREGGLRCKQEGGSYSVNGNRRSFPRLARGSGWVRMFPFWSGFCC